MKRNPQHTITKGMVRDICSESSRSRLLHRLHSVALVEHGLSSSEVATIFDDSPRAVAYWVKRFRQHGLTGLEEELRPGRPSKLDPKQLKKLQLFIRKSQTAAKPMKVEAVARYILKEFHVVLTQSQCWRILKRLST